MQELSTLLSQLDAYQFEAPSRLRLVTCVGGKWPEVITSRPVKSIDPGRLLQRLADSNLWPFWIGYISPVDLLINTRPNQASDLVQKLDTWLEHTAIFLKAKELATSDTRLINLSLLKHETTASSHDDAPKLPLLLQLYLQRRQDIMQRYADLEREADSFGGYSRQPLEVLCLSNHDWHSLLLKAWEVQECLPELQSSLDALQSNEEQLVPLQEVLRRVLV